MFEPHASLLSETSHFDACLEAKAIFLQYLVACSWQQAKAESVLYFSVQY